MSGQSETYKGWTVSPCEFRPGIWTAVGPNYDAWTDAEGEWTDNGHTVEARGYDEVLVAIEDWIADQ